MEHIPNWNDQDYCNYKEIENTSREERIKICDLCEELTKLKFCNQCKCFMPVKTWFESQSCPLGKW
jgi:hypothetical protein